MFKLTWPDTAYADLIPESWFSEVGSKPACQHDLVGPRGSRYPAKCTVSVHESKADLDYRPFQKFNEDNDIDLGVVRLEFSSKARKNIVRVLWQGPGDNEFTPCDDVAIGVDLEAEVEKSLRASPDERKRRLRKAPTMPERIRTVSLGFRRNSDVIAEVLTVADGRCQSCKKRAPFNRAANGRPYLEVHHRVRLADGGEDTVANAIALCPNCHRKAHYG